MFAPRKKRQCPMHREIIHSGSNSHANADENSDKHNVTVDYSLRKVILGGILILTFLLVPSL
jgi:hypothetical protein